MLLLFLAQRGNHIWDEKETMEFITSEKRLLRPKNLVEGSIVSNKLLRTIPCVLSPSIVRGSSITQPQGFMPASSSLG